MSDPFLLLMPSYNQARYIRSAVESVLAQDDPDWELWIYDNSSDETPQVMAEFKDPRIHFIHEPRRMDPGTCLNELLRMAKGTFFSYAHTDNLLRKSYVRRFREALGEDPMGVAYCSFTVIDGEGRVQGEAVRGEWDLETLCTLHANVGVPFAAGTALAKAIGGFPTDSLADDIAFLIRGHGRGRWTLIPESLLDYRHHEDSRFLSAGEQLDRRLAKGILAEAQRAASEGRPQARWADRIQQWLAHAAALESRLASVKDETRERIRAFRPMTYEAPTALNAWLLSDLPFAAAQGPWEARLGLPMAEGKSESIALLHRVGRHARAEALRGDGARVWCPRRPNLPFGFRHRWEGALKQIEAAQAHRGRVLPALAVLHPEAPRRWALRGRGLGAFALAAWARTWWETEPLGWVDPAGTEQSWMGWPVLAELPKDWEDGRDLLLG